MTTLVRRSPRIALLNARKEMEKYQNENNLKDYENHIDSKPLKDPQPQKYTCMQMSFMIADLTLALVNLACIIRWIYW